MHIGIDIGGTKLIAAASLPGKKARFSQKIATPADPRAAVAAIAGLVHDLGAGQPLSHIAVACPGPLDLRSGRLGKLHNLDPAWHGFRLSSQLEKALGRPVRLENDANAAAFYEATAGAAKGKRHVLYLTDSTGIGTGIVIGGHIYHGRYDSEGGATPVGDPHRRIPPTLEDSISGRAIVRRFGKPAYDIRDKAVWQTIADELAFAIAGMADLISPDIVVLGGGVSVHWPRFGVRLNRRLATLARKYPMPQVVAAKAAELGAVLGALLIAHHQPGIL